MRKVLKDTKILLFENMVKLNPDFKLKQETLNESVDMNQFFDPNEYQDKVQAIKSKIDNLIKSGDSDNYGIIDTLYKLIVGKGKSNIVNEPIQKKPQRTTGSGTLRDVNLYEEKLALIKESIGNISKDKINTINEIINKILPESKLNETWTDGTNYNPEENNPTPFEYFIETLPEVTSIAIKYPNNPMRWGGYLAKNVNFKGKDDENAYFYFDPASDTGQDEEGNRTYSDPQKEGNVLVVPFDTIVDVDNSLGGSYGATLVIDEKKKNKIYLQKHGV